ncbi:aldolase/citrate lyase family protein [Sphingomonas sp.]|uniref:aldolase/citrate lyase family protein n=1 Tax=Sphingomonas sp. TaxID=28214 RepID=UPI003D6D4775
MTPLANPFKATLRAGRRQIGLWQALANPYTAEICAGAGFDWLLFDGEHAPNTIPTMLAQLQAVAPYPVHPVARLPVGETALIKQYLDIGFQTLLIPFVESAEQARILVRATRYPPAGVRGIGTGLARAARWNRTLDYLDAADAEICLLVQIETTAGLSDLDAILAVDGVDGVFVGAADLSAAMGYRGQPLHPEMAAVIDSVIARIVAAGKAAGTLALDVDTIARTARAGCSFIAVGTDVGLLAKGSVELARGAGGVVAIEGMT